MGDVDIEYDKIDNVLVYMDSLSRKQVIERIVNYYGFDTNDIFPYHECSDNCGCEPERECDTCGAAMDCNTCNPPENTCDSCGDFLHDVQCGYCKPKEQDETREAVEQPAWTGKSAFA